MKVYSPKVGADEAPKVGAAEAAPKVGAAEVAPKVGAPPNAGVDPKLGVVVAPNAGAVELAPKEVLAAPNAGVVVVPKAGAALPNVGAEDAGVAPKRPVDGCEVAVRPKPVDAGL